MSGPKRFIMPRELGKVVEAAHKPIDMPLPIDNLHIARKGSRIMATATDGHILLQADALVDGDLFTDEESTVIPRQLVESLNKAKAAGNVEIIEDEAYISGHFANDLSIEDVRADAAKYPGVTGLLVKRKPDATIVMQGAGLVKLLKAMTAVGGELGEITIQLCAGHGVVRVTAEDDGLRFTGLVLADSKFADSVLPKKAEVEDPELLPKE